MKLYSFWIGESAASVAIGLRANSPEEAVVIVRQEFEQHGRTMNEGPSKRLMEGMLAQVGLDPSELARLKFYEFNVEMASAKFESLAVKADPAQITTDHILWEKDESGRVVWNPNGQVLIFL